MTPRKARSLEVLLQQVNRLAPGRDKSSDGWLGDAAHAARTSDHNPDENGVVRALDITRDVRQGVDTYALAKVFQANKDSRIKYIISNRHIMGGRLGPKPWIWRGYDGQNPHDMHIHISVNREGQDDLREWDIALSKPDTSAPIAAAEVFQRLSRGSTGPEVRRLQRLLNIDRVDGIFGKATEAAVKVYQRANGLGVDGIVGRYTWRDLEEKAT